MTPGTKTHDTELEQDAEALYAAVRRLIRTYQFRDRQRTCYHDISVTQCYALEALQSGAMRLNDLSEALRLEKSSASRMIDSLQDKGYVRRGADPADGRATIIDITPRGQRVHDDIVESLIEEKRELLAGVGKAARRAAIRIVDELSCVAEDRFGESGDGCTPEPAQTGGRK